MQQALHRIGRDDIVHKLNKNDLDSEGDSLRLADSSNLNRSDFSSRGSLGPPEKILSSSAVSDPGRSFLKGLAFTSYFFPIIYVF